jgi:hypothetical protein
MTEQPPPSQIDQLSEILLDLGLGDHWRIQHSIEGSYCLFTRCTRNRKAQHHEANIIANALHDAAIPVQVYQNGVAAGDVIAWPKKR